MADLEIDPGALPSGKSVGIQATEVEIEMRGIFGHRWAKVNRYFSTLVHWTGTSRHCWSRRAGDAECGAYISPRHRKKNQKR